MSVTIAEVDAEIASLVADMSAAVDYRIVQKEVKASQKLEGLLKVRKALIENPEAEISLMTFDFNVDEMGEDKREKEL